VGAGQDAFFVSLGRAGWNAARDVGLVGHDRLETVPRRGVKIVPGWRRYQPFTTLALLPGETPRGGATGEEPDGGECCRDRRVN